MSSLYTRVPHFFPLMNFAWIFWTAGLNWEEAFWETWVFPPKKKLLQRLEHLMWSQLDILPKWFCLPLKTTIFLYISQDLSSREIRVKVTSSRQGYLTCLPHTFLLLLFCFLPQQSNSLLRFFQFWTCLLFVMYFLVVVITFCYFQFKFARKQTSSLFIHL